MERAWFSRVDLRPEITSSSRFIRLLGSDGYGIHQLLWRLFPDEFDRSRNFLYHRRSPDEAVLPSFYVVSGRPPVAHEAWYIHAPREYVPRLRVGDQLLFRLRANPVVSRRGGEDGARVIRHDVVMDAKRRSGDDACSADVEYVAGRAWLETRGVTHGFALEAVSVGAYVRHRLFKRAHQPITFSTLDYEGILRVTDPERLRAALFAGIGPAKGFGCGLLLVRRA